MRCIVVASAMTLLLIGGAHAQTVAASGGESVEPPIGAEIGAIEVSPAKVPSAGHPPKDCNACRIVIPMPFAHCIVISLCRRLAARGDADAQFSLGVMYGQGDGVPRDRVAAAKWFEMSAKHGKLSEQSLRSRKTYLAMMYESGIDVPQDPQRAIYWYRMAARVGDTEAERVLGYRYLDGFEVPQNFVEAAGWFLKAADQGDTSSQFDLGIMYAKGQGVNVDFVRAHVWLNLAASRLSRDDPNRDLAEKNRDIVAAKMSASQIADAQRTASAWVPHHSSTNSEAVGRQSKRDRKQKPHRNLGSV